MTLQTAKNRARIVPASAGSGKTYCIAHEYIYDVLRDRYDENGRSYFDSSFYKRILAVTFTNKATEEMKSRILKEIHLLASGAKSDHLEELVNETKLSEKELRRRAKIVRSLILHDYSHFTVLTNDTFFQRILRAFVKELGIDMNFSTELDTAPLLSKSVEVLIDNITENKDLRDWLEGLVEEQISDSGHWNIRKAITSLDKELFKESTKDIIEKNGDKKKLKQTIDEFNKVIAAALNLYKAKGAEALEKIYSRGYSHDNFNKGLTAYFDKVAEGTLLDVENATYIKRMTGSLDEWFTKTKKATPDLLALAGELQEMLVEVHSMCTNLTTLENTRRILQKNYRGFALLHDLQKVVEEECREENSMLLSETKHAIAGFISESEAPFIYEKVGNYFDKFMIDEFQDTSFKEWRNFLPLLRNAMSQSTDTSVLIVGDVKQSIYRWRGGDWRILGGEIHRDLVDVSTVPLKNNWRSLPNIVEFNNALFTSAIERENATLNAQLDEADAAHRISAECKAELYDTLKRAYANHEQTPRRKHTNCGYISITAPTEGLEGEQELLGKSGMPLYVERIKEVLEKGFLPRDITILVRKNSHGMVIAEELLHYREMFPKELWFEITTEEALSLTASPAVKLVIAVMRLAINRKDTASLVQYHHLHNANRFDSELTDEENAFLDAIRMMSLEEAFENITIRYAEDIKNDAAYIMAMHEHIVRFSTGKVADIALFDKWWGEKSDDLSVRVERSERSIEILTIHKSKGLENKVIIIPYCSWSLLPLTSSGRITNIVWAEPLSKSAAAEVGTFPVPFTNTMERSLFADGFFREMIYTRVDALNMLYVATTRAKEQLHMFLLKPKSSYKPKKESKKPTSTVSSLLLEMYAELMQQPEGANYRCYEIGTFDSPEPSKAEESVSSCRNVVLNKRHTSPVTLKLRTSVGRYFADEKSDLSPRSMGIRLHRAFEGATTRDEIFAALEEMTLNGELQRAEVEELKMQVTATLDKTVAGEWFDGSWSQLYRERNIIRPNAPSKRPDRVLTRGSEAVVIDYKFGEEKSSYNRQVSKYMSELRQMGYTSVKGYVWYVPIGKIDSIQE